MVGCWFCPLWLGRVILFAVVALAVWLGYHPNWATARNHCNVVTFYAVFPSDVFFTQVQHQHISKVWRTDQNSKNTSTFENVKGNTNLFFGLVWFSQCSHHGHLRNKRRSSPMSFHMLRFQRKKIQSNWTVKHDLPICPLHGNRKSHRKSSIYPSKLI